jgi:hypothetical protein
MATLENKKIKDTYGTLLKTTSGNIGAGFTVVQDGQANDSGLSLSEDGVGVSSLTFTTAPTTDATESTALMLNGSNEAVKRDLAASAFQLPDVQAGNGINVTGGFPTFTVQNSLPDQTVAITGVGIDVGGSYPNFTLTNSAPDQTVAISGTGGVSVTGTYPTFTVDGSSITGVGEEMFVGIIESSYPLAPATPQVLAFTAADNAREDRSYHFGVAPAKLTMPNPEVVLNSSNAEQIVYIDMSAYIQVNGNNKSITYRLQTNTGTGWVTKQEATRSKSAAGLHVDSFWGIFIVAVGEQVRIQVESQTGDVDVTPMTQVKFQVKEKGNIV